jgi:4-amino-4-deoxy-L-arabinose transferase-like glycosyltransferase
MDEAVGHSDRAGAAGKPDVSQRFRRYELVVVLFAAAVFLACIVSPPSLMDDVDSVQAQIARNMLDSGDWVTARLDGVAYLEKAPAKYWSIAVSFAIFGVHDWSARLPIALFAVLLCWVTARMAAWAFSELAGLYAGLALATCIGLFLFTRILIPDATLTLFIALAMWAFLRALDEAEPHPRRWAAVLAASIAIGLLLKGLIAAVFPVGAALAYLAVTRRLFDRQTWRRLHLFSGILIVLAIAAPWHILATIRNPPYFAWNMHSGPGEYHGFFWFYFINEHLLRFLNLRYPRDYNTVPRALFWLLHLVWLFPWTVFLPGALKLGYRPVDRAGRTRLLALCWIGFVLVFFTFSSTQEYYSMPCYPAFALLLGCAIGAGKRWVSIARRIVAGIAIAAAAAIVYILVNVWSTPAPGDISKALAQHPEEYTLSLGHMGDLTMQSFAYLRTPLIVAGIAFVIGAAGLLLLRGLRAYLAIAVMMVVFFQAARLALVVFDPYLSSRPLADALLKAPPGTLIEDHAYYTFSSVFFYTGRQDALLLNGRENNLEYGSYAPNAPHVFIDNTQFARLWAEPQRCYLLVEGPRVPLISAVVGQPALHVVTESGGKYLFTNYAGPD